MFSKQYSISLPKKREVTAMNTVRAMRAEAGSAMNRSLKHYSQLFKSRSIVNFDEKNEVSSLLLDK